MKESKNTEKVKPEFTEEPKNTDDPGVGKKHGNGLSDETKHDINTNAKSSGNAEKKTPEGKTKPVDNNNENAQDLQSQYDEMNDKYLRLYSEFDNFKRRTAKERIELYKSAGEVIIIALLPVLDDFERAIKSNEETNDIKISEGVRLVYNKIKNVLAQKGLENMNSMKKVFDTDMHEAITHIPAPSKKLKGKVVDVIEKGYLLNGKVIRYAKVVVGK